LLAHSKAAAGDIPFLLAVSPGGVLRILELVGVLHVLRIYSDLAVASAAVTEAAA
jgi:hypothetical protein